ncbi:MAG: tetratricopeptide repeat protein [Tannerellaceae bacterium]|nr:tetratricopeptide repeat protein [Tannerellaceae bacterium]
MFAQKAERQNIREGNKLYKAEKFTEAEIAYRKSTEVNPRSVEGAYNLGNALYKEGKYPEAAEQYQLVLGQGERLLKENSNNLQKLAQVLHNTGNIHMQGKDYAKSIEAYKQSLRLDPTNDETRYNLALAQKLLDDQQQDQENQDNQDQQNQEEQQEQQQPQDNQQKSQEEQQQNEQMSRDNAQQILDAFLQDEKDTQDKVKQMQQQHSQRPQGKQW